jgi:hypothetical protein
MWKKEYPGKDLGESASSKEAEVTEMITRNTTTATVNLIANSEDRNVMAADCRSTFMGIIFKVQYTNH